MADKEYALYLGCIIPYREMSYEISARRVVKDLGIVLHDMPDANCCGLPVDPVNHETMIVLAARNLCIAEEMGLDIFTLCNGCTGALMKVNKMLKGDRDLKAHVNAQLKSLDKEFKGTIKVRHMAQVLSDMGSEALKKFITKPLTFLTVAGYTGCHIFRPSEFMEVKNPENPSILNDLIEVTGAKSVKYIDELQCCGFVEGAIDSQIPLYLAREKFRNAKNVGADIMVTICPSCHQVLDANQTRAERMFSETYNLPVLHYPQLLGLAMGIPPEELALKDLRVKPTTLLESFGKT
ncbi:CoB--CoM heterodisulfide reductase subunit B [Candidatus Bathyarchaeota archaeon]|nr:MAG: CoB--CoM heterodisulfide reductase subunit B [Candidatus Bathyarchaeota archaeon]